MQIHFSHCGSDYYFSHLACNAKKPSPQHKTLGSDKTAAIKAQNKEIRMGMY